MSRNILPWLLATVAGLHAPLHAKPMQPVLTRQALKNNAPPAQGEACAATLFDRVVRYDIDASLDPVKHTGLALLFGVLRVQVDGSSVGGWLAAFALTQPVVAMLAWARIARLYGLAALATDAKVVQPARIAAIPQTEAVAELSHAAPALA